MVLGRRAFNRIRFRRFCFWGFAPGEGARAGFASILVAIGLVMLGLALTLPLAPSRSALSLEQWRDTQARLRTIDQALVAFFVEEGRLPRPSAPGSTLEGDEAAANVLMGGVPLTPLGLDPRFARDAWNQPLRYAVTTALTRKNAQAAGILEIGGDATAPQTGQAWVLASPGRNGVLECRAGETRFERSPHTAEYDDVLRFGRLPE